ncbi:hypothetical protein AB7W88_17340, partial [Providencia vermicola]
LRSPLALVYWKSHQCHGLKFGGKVTSFNVIPGNHTYSIGQFYIRPGENKAVNITGNATDITIAPLSRYGFKLESDVNVKVKH